jgi:hypothetical protein
MDYKNKYLKYKNKYLDLKNNFRGGSNLEDTTESICNNINENFNLLVKDIENYTNFKTFFIPYFNFKILNKKPDKLYDIMQIIHIETISDATLSFISTLLITIHYLLFYNIKNYIYNKIFLNPIEITTISEDKLFNNNINFNCILKCIIINIIYFINNFFMITKTPELYHKEYDNIFYYILNNNNHPYILNIKLLFLNLDTNNNLESMYPNIFYMDNEKYTFLINNINNSSSIQYNNSDVLTYINLILQSNF